MGGRGHVSALASLLCLSACAVDETPGVPVLEIGTGLEAFAPIADGDTLGLICGSQGSQHVWVSLRTQHVAVDPALVGATLRAQEGEPLSPPLQLRLRFTASDDGRWSETIGILLEVPGREPRLGELLDLEVWVEEERGERRRFEEVVSVELAWATRPCIP